MGKNSLMWISYLCMLGINNVFCSSHEYVAVYFRGECADNKEVDCDEVLADLETIDEDLDEIGIMMTTTKDTQVSLQICQELFLLY